MSATAFPSDPGADPDAAKAWWRAQPARIPYLINQARKDVRCALRACDMDAALTHVRIIVGLRQADRIMRGERIRCQWSVAELVETNRVRI